MSGSTSFGMTVEVKALKYKPNLIQRLTSISRPAVTPDVAADSLIKFIEKFDMKSTGEYWAPRGPGCVILPLMLLIDAQTDLQIVTSVRLKQSLDRRISSARLSSCHGERASTSNDDGMIDNLRAPLQ